MNFDNVRAVFFDAGNTLLMLDYERVAQALTELGLRVTSRRLIELDYQRRMELDREIGGRDVQASEAQAGRDYFEPLALALNAPVELVPQLRRRLLELDVMHQLWAKVDPQTPSALLRLKQAGLMLGVISNADGTVREKLRAVGLEDYFKVVVDSQIVGVEKPKRRIFEIALEQAKVSAAQSLFIGDVFSVDVLGARRAGMRAVLFDPHGLYEIQEERVRSLAELASRICIPKC